MLLNRANLVFVARRIDMSEEAWQMPQGGIDIGEEPRDAALRHIADGDFVLIRPQTTARNGDIVVAQVEENAVTLKRFFKEKDQIRLQPANPAYPPQFYADVRIQGKLIGVIRRLD